MYKKVKKKKTIDKYIKKNIFKNLVKYISLIYKKLSVEWDREAKS